jgi:hypothetical protein
MGRVSFDTAMGMTVRGALSGEFNGTGSDAKTA